MQIVQMTKKQFKQMYKNGELLLLDGGIQHDAQWCADKLEERLENGVDLSDYASNTTHHENIDDKHHTIWYNEENNLIFLQDLWEEDNIAHTTVYLIRS